ncbi:MAG: hypothetical protein M3305_03860 [Actinomycetota bacterium]|nr:hypothetical protein [Actinomycetota bacterium]
MLAGVEVEDAPPHARPGPSFVDDPSEPPTEEEYKRYIWLVELLRRATYEEAQIRRSYPFLAKDALFSSALVAANTALGI